MPEASAGEPCDSLTEGALLDSNCTPGLICLPEGVCGSPLALGDSCWADYPCATGICREGRCAAPGARRLGDTCTEEGDCGPDLTCDQICYEALPSGSGCVGPGAWEACADGLGCWRGRCAAP